MTKEVFNEWKKKCLAALESYLEFAPFCEDDDCPEDILPKNSLYFLLKGLDNNRKPIFENKNYDNMPSFIEGDSRSETETYSPQNTNGLRSLDITEPMAYTIWLLNLNYED